MWTKMCINFTIIKSRNSYETIIFDDKNLKMTSGGRTRGSSNFGAIKFDARIIFISKRIRN